jgi:hypothetical protein
MKSFHVLGLLLLAFVSSAHAGVVNKIKVSKIEVERMTETRTSFSLMNQGEVTGRLICEENSVFGYPEGEAAAVGFINVAYGTELQIDFKDETECNSIVDDISARLLNGDVVVLFDDEQILSVQN